MESLIRDLRQAFRKLVRSPGLSAVTIVALAVGIGLTTMMFSIIYGAFWRPLPFEDPQELVHLERSNLAEGITSMEVTIHEYVDWRQEQRSFEDLAAFYSGTVNIAGTEQRAERFNGAFITPNAFRLLRVSPFMGRTFLDEEAAPSADPVILLGHHVWRDRYDGDADMVGKTVRANGRAATVVGVMPEDFRFPILQDVWLPLRLDPLTLARGEGQTLEIFGRLRDGVSLDQAAADMAGVASRIALEYPETNEGVSTVLKPYAQEYVGGDDNRIAYTMLGGVIFVLLIACANVASLLLARAVQRTKELGVRTALGARRWRLVAQFLVEAFAIALVGAIIGLGIAWVGVGWFNRAIADTGAPFWIVIGIDGMSLLFAAGAVLLATVASGGLPAWQAARADVGEILKDESRGSSSFRIGRLSRGLVVFEMALSCALLVAAGLTVRSVIRLNTIDYAFHTENIYTARFALLEGQDADPAAAHRFFEELQDRLAANPAVEAATLTTGLPGLGTGMRPFAAEGKTYSEDRDYPLTRFTSVAPDFFETFGVAPVAGRTLGREDREGAMPVAVVSHGFAARHFEGEALGRRIRLGRSASEEPWRTIVGVVPNMHAGGAGDQDQVAVYLPLAQTEGTRFLSIAARTRGDPTAVAPDVREVMQSLNADIPLYFVGALATRIAEANWQFGIFGSIFGMFGLVALFLAAVGLYAVMAFAVTQRTREVGVRMALGARAGDVLRMILRQGMVQIGIGLVFGLLIAAGLAQLLTEMLFDVNPRDPLTFIGTAAVLIMAGALASLIPARRATRVDPVEALHTE